MISKVPFDPLWILGKKFSTVMKYFFEYQSATLNVLKRMPISLMPSML